MEKRSPFRNFIRSKLFTLLIMLILLVVVLTITTRGSLVKITNIRQILDQMFVPAMLTIAAGILMISGNIDLSSGVVGTYAGIMMVYLVNVAGWPWYFAIAVTLLVSLVFGIMNAVMINELNFPGFVATLATASMVEGISFVYSGGATINLRHDFLKYLGNGRLFGEIPLSVILLAAAFIIYGLILSRSKFGRQVYLVGGNPNAARLSGVNPKRVSYTLFVNSALLASLAGMFLAFRVSSATSQGIKANQFTGITAAILGGISFGGGSGNMTGAFVGLLILTAFSNGMILLGFDSYWRPVISGALLILALVIDYISIRRTAKSMK